MTENPDKVLLESILKKIEDSSLITEKVLARYRKAITEGTMTAEDWVLVAESLDAKMEK